eukprot:TRINITY_DN666_c0_g1_i1.p1 TRINITY_DN666_c0_g1~~TRINITY_DN666_c0_g1_i1.p1  ORF type:complete len:631 (-),score=110.22 TRINITY_DN666_c0_g1_i1:28-1920(-)
MEWALGEEIQTTVDPTELFREVSISSLLMDEIISISLKPWVQNVIIDLIKNITDKDELLELDTTRVEEKVAHRSSISLRKHSKWLLDKMGSELDHFPKFLRYLFNVIRREVEKIFPDVLYPDFGLLGVASFVFLRSVVTAVCFPETYDITDIPISTNSRRALILISKIIQNTANFIEFDGSKEEYMIRMNTFILRYTTKMRTFLRNVSNDESKHSILEDVPDYITPEMKMESLENIVRLLLENKDSILRNIDDESLLIKFQGLISHMEKLPINVVSIPQKKQRSKRAKSRNRRKSDLDRSKKPSIYSKNIKRLSFGSNLKLVKPDPRSNFIYYLQVKESTRPDAFLLAKFIIEVEDKSDNVFAQSEIVDKYFGSEWLAGQLQSKKLNNMKEFFINNYCTPEVLNQGLEMAYSYLDSDYRSYIRGNSKTKSKFIDIVWDEYLYSRFFEYEKVVYNHNSLRAYTELWHYQHNVESDKSESLIKAQYLAAKYLGINGLNQLSSKYKLSKFVSEEVRAGIAPKLSLDNFSKQVFQQVIASLATFLENEYRDFLENTGSKSDEKRGSRSPKSISPRRHRTRSPQKRSPRNKIDSGHRSPKRIRTVRSPSSTRKHQRRNDRPKTKKRSNSEPPDRK